MIGTTSLGGPSISNGTANNIMRHRVEIKATIAPNNFDELVTLQREIVENRGYNGQNLTSRFVGCPDTSNISLLDLSPSSDGNVYDYDAPGILIGSAQPDGTVIRRRTNFKQWLTVFQHNGDSAAEVVISDNIFWFQRISLTKLNATTQVINTSVTGDNTVNTGTTGLDWDLGTSSSTTNNGCPS